MSYLDRLPPEAVRAHDLAREVPEELWTEAIDQLIQRVGPAADIRRCVDVGIGTGAVGGRLADRGIPVLGVDCNRTMLDHLAGTHPDLPVAQGDAAAVPLAPAVADLTVLACLLHLVYDWRAALAEAVRVTAPGGVVAVNIGQSGLAGRTGVSRYFLDHLTSSTELPPMPGPADPNEVPQALEALGAEELEPVTVQGTARRTVAEQIFRLEWNPFGWPPGTPQDRLSAAAEATRAWARTEFGPLDEPRDTPVAIGFRVFRTAGRSRRG